MPESQANTDVENDIKGLVAEILEMESNEVTPEAHFVQDLGMDSMMALEILAGVEKKYKITIPEEALPKFINLKATVDIVQDIINNK